MIIHAEIPIHYVLCLLDLCCSFYKLDQKEEEEEEKYQLPLTESLNRLYIQKVISLDYHIILCRVEALQKKIRAALLKDFLYIHR